MSEHTTPSIVTGMACFSVLWSWLSIFRSSLMSHSLFPSFAPHRHFFGLELFIRIIDSACLGLFVVLVGIILYFIALICRVLFLIGVYFIWQPRRSSYV